MCIQYQDAAFVIETINGKKPTLDRLKGSETGNLSYVTMYIHSKSIKTFPNAMHLAQQAILKW